MYKYVWFFLFGFFQFTIPVGSHASELEGIYSASKYINPERVIRNSGKSVMEGDVYIIIQELEDQTLVLLLLNPTTNNWQAFTGMEDGNIVVFNQAISQEKFPIQVRSQEIRIVTNELGNLLYTHLLILDPAYVVDGDGRALMIDSLVLYKISSAN